MNSKFLVLILISSIVLLSGCNNNNTNAICGDGTCSPEESAFSCPQDCILNQNEPNQQVIEEIREVNNQNDFGVSESEVRTLAGAISTQTTTTCPTIGPSFDPRLNDFPPITGDIISNQGFTRTDGIITGLDALAAQAKFLQLGVPVDENCMDTNGDGYATNLDAVVLQSIFLWLIPPEQLSQMNTGATLLKNQIDSDSIPQIETDILYGLPTGFLLNDANNGSTIINDLNIVIGAYQYNRPNYPENILGLFTISRDGTLNPLLTKKSNGLSTPSIEKGDVITEINLNNTFNKLDKPIRIIEINEDTIRIDFSDPQQKIHFPTEQTITHKLNGRRYQVTQEITTDQNSFQIVWTPEIPYFNQLQDDDLIYLLTPNHPYEDTIGIINSTSQNRMKINDTNYINGETTHGRLITINSNQNGIKSIESTRVENPPIDIPDPLPPNIIYELSYEIEENGINFDVNDSADFFIYWSDSLDSEFVKINPEAIESNGLRDEYVPWGTNYYYVENDYGERSNTIEVEFLPPASERMPDVDLLFVERNPKYDRLILDGEFDNPYKENCFNGGDFWGNELVCLPKALNPDGKKYPDEGEEVEFTAFIRNSGSAPTERVIVEWEYGIYRSTMQIENIEVGETIEVKRIYPWSEENELVVEARLENGEEISLENNVRRRTGEAWYLRYMADKAQWKVYRARQNMLGTYSLEDWAQEHFEEFNNELIEVRQDYQGVIDFNNNAPRIELDRFYVIPEYRHGGEHYGAESINKFDGGWQNVTYHTNEPQTCFDESAPEYYPLFADYLNEVTCEPINGRLPYIMKIDRGLLHEVGHQLGLIDNYWTNLDLGYSNEVSGESFAIRGLMSTVEEMTKNELLALESMKGTRRGLYGTYSFDIPERNYIVLKDGDREIEGTIRIYRPTPALRLKSVNPIPACTIQEDSECASDPERKQTVEVEYDPYFEHLFEGVLLEINGENTIVVEIDSINVFENEITFRRKRSDAGVSFESGTELMTGNAKGVISSRHPYFDFNEIIKENGKGYLIPNKQGWNYLIGETGNYAGNNPFGKLDWGGLSNFLLIKVSMGDDGGDYIYTKFLPLTVMNEQYWIGNESEAFYEFDISSDAKVIDPLCLGEWSDCYYIEQHRQ